MKKIHVAGTALAGMLAVGAFQTKGVQSNPAGQTPAATASATPPAAPAGGSPVAPGGVQAGGQFNFAEDQDKTITLNLRPDQTAYTEVRIVYKRVQPNEDSSKDKKCPCAAEKKSKDDAAKKKNALRKEGDGKETKVPPANPNAASTGRAAKDQSGTVSSAPIPLKFNFDMITPYDGQSFDGKSFNFSRCTTAASPLVADSFWKLDGPQQTIPINITSCSPNGGEGKLTIANSSGERRELTVILNSRRSPCLQKAMLASLGIAVLVSLVCALFVWLHGHKMRDRIGEASWDFSSSWASNITAFGAGLTFLLGLTVFPDKPFFGTKLEYSFLAAFAAAMVAIAPALHRMMSVGAATAADGGSTTSDSTAAAAQGYVGGFLTASIFTMWGALLQVAIGLLIVRELTTTVMIYGPLGKVVAVTAGLTGLGLIVYSVTTILSTIGGNAERSGTPATTQISETLTAEAPVREKRMKMPISVL